MHSWAPLQVLHGDTDVLFPVSGVGSYSPAGGCALTARSLQHELCLREPQGCLGPLCWWEREQEGLLGFGVAEGLAPLLTEPRCVEVPAPA